MKKITEKMADALQWLHRTESEAHIDTDDGGYARQFRALLDRGLVRWDAISSGTCGGWILTAKGGRYMSTVLECECEACRYSAQTKE